MDDGKREKELLRATIVKSKASIRRTLALGKLPVNQEIVIRAEMAQMLVHTDTSVQQQEDIEDAIQHLETILRRLPRDSEDRAKHSNNLSFANMSLYQRTNSTRALDEAIATARQAYEVAKSSNLLQRDAETYYSILTNLGFSLSHRYAVGQDCEDLTSAIHCSEDTYENAPKQSEAYLMNLNNFASRLRLKYLHDNDVLDITKAMSLLKELENITVPGTAQHGSALAQMGFFSADKFTQTNALEDLDEALRLCKLGLDTLPMGHETRLPIFVRIVDLYRARYRATNQSADVKRLEQHSQTLLSAIPVKHTLRVKYLKDYLGNLKSLAFASDSLKEVRKAVKIAEKLTVKTSYGQPDLWSCQRIVAEIFGKQYRLSSSARDFHASIEYISGIQHDFNTWADKSGSCRPLMNVIPIQNLQAYLAKIISASSHNEMKLLAEDELSSSFNKFCSPPNDLIGGLENLLHQSAKRLQALSDAISSDSTLTEEDINAAMAKLHETEARESVEQERISKLKFAKDDYHTELGVRSLAMGDGGEIVVTLRSVMEDVLGLDATKKYSPEEFTSILESMEQKALDEVRAAGRHPNLQLCRMCRDICKVLRPKDDGYELTATNAALPFGNYYQLRLRKTCAICHLILATITDKGERLHPRLAAIDPEIQGIRLSTGKLSTGEKVLRFDYGMKQISELRVLTSQNAVHALRQGWELDQQFSIANLENGNGPVQSGDQMINIGLIKSWLNDCDHNHGSKCNQPHLSQRTEVEIPMTLIDVLQDCLVSSTSDAKYFALSYIWGKVDMSRTLKSNFESRKEPFSLSKAGLPRTIQDAIGVVILLGHRYLWVDAICLIQDDPESMAREIPLMDRVYGQAFATIVALEGDDANAGLPGISPGSRTPQLLRSVSVTAKSPILDDNPDCDTKDTIALVATPRPLHLALELSRWNQRGWIVQERFLSRRCLYFSRDVVYFQCGEQTLCEGGVNEVFDSHLMNDSTIPLHDNHLLQQANNDNPLVNLDVSCDLFYEERLTSAVDAYQSLVSIYSQRQLSFKADILNAFAGLSNVIKHYFQSSIHYGLPASILCHALLWSPAARIHRRGTQLVTQVARQEFSHSQPDPIFPSWSWAGWDGPVEYRLFETLKRNRSVKYGVLRLYLPVPRVQTFETINGPANQPFANTMTTTVSPEESSKGLSTSGLEDEMRRKESRAGNESGVRKLTTVVTDEKTGKLWTVVAARTPEQRKDPEISAKMLRFNARTVCLPKFRVIPPKEYLSLTSNVHVQGSQAVRRIHDGNGKHCGLWWEQAGYGYVGLGLSPEAESKIELLELSSYGNAYRVRDGPSRVEGPIPMFDKGLFPEFGEGSGLVNILAVDLDVGLPNGISERVTVAVIHSKAWEAAAPQWKEVQLV